MLVEKLTQKYVDGLQPANKRYEVRDTEARHLVLRVTPSGRKTFVFFRRIHGKLKRRTIGEFPDYTVIAARDEVARLNGIVAAGEPLDPVKTEPLTFAGLFQRFLEEHSKRTKRTWRQDEAEYNRYLKGFADRQAAEIERGDIREWHSAMVRKHGNAQANRTLALIRKVYNFAIDCELLHHNPADRIKQAKVQSRERFLSPEELRRFFAEIEKPKHARWRDFFLLLLYTGQRRGNVQAMQWRHIDFDNGIWHIPRDQTKNEAPYAVPLIEEALSLLRDRRGEVESEWVFPGNSKSGHVQEPKKPWADLCKDAGLEDVRLHDLRRTMGSYQAAGNTSLQIIGRSLGHKSSQATEVYARLQLDPVREAMQKAAAAMRQT